MKMLFAAALLVAGPAVAQTAPPTPNANTGSANTGPTLAQPPAKAPALPGATARPKPVVAPPQVSRNAPINGVLTLFGNERCPTNQNGEEIVVCVRRSAQEQYRVPKELREFVVTPENASWATKAQGTMDAGSGVNTIGSCSAVGAGGATGCFGQRVRESRLENKTRAAEVPVLP
ncbi:hypothetical protein [Sphingomonas sp. PP-CC-3A-396]|uniref:hypothetical protein n=1 Tax=Sphingomonas sp. PP-CC-3A-396 TaxID=2135655 RepID=UPI00104441BC|nr:hypothetical protein [Sphingomonas sp. PP-CC-3A-396]TCQ10855.1 hypothetical protein C8J40_101239 [Sphingomonas sp. PP-CC-3A-396]